LEQPVGIAQSDGVGPEDFGNVDNSDFSYGSRLCENASSRDPLRIFFLGRALTVMSEDFLAAISPKSTPKFHFEKERPSFHTAWVKSGSADDSARESASPRIAALLRCDLRPT
jgi:hypothetical protein